MADLYHNLFGQTVDQYGNAIPMPSTAPPEGYNVKTFPESIADAPQAAMPQPLTMFDAQKEFQQYDQPEPWGVDRTIKTIIGAPFRAVGALDAVLKNAIGTPTPEDIALNARALLDKDESTKATGRPASMLDTFMGTITGDAQRGMNAWNRIVLEQKQRAAAAKAGLEQNLGRQSLLKGSNELAGQALDLGIKLKTAREKADLEVDNLRSQIGARGWTTAATRQRMGLTRLQIAKLNAQSPYFDATAAADVRVIENRADITDEQKDALIRQRLGEVGAGAAFEDSTTLHSLVPGPESKAITEAPPEARARVYKELQPAITERRQREAPSKRMTEEEFTAREKTKAEMEQAKKDYAEVQKAYSKKHEGWFTGPTEAEIQSQGDRVLRALRDGKISFLEAMQIKRGDKKEEDFPALAPTPVPNIDALPPTGATPTPAPPYEPPSPGLVEPRSTPKPLAERTDDGGSLPRGKAEDLSRFGAEDERQARPVWDEINAHSRPPITDPVKNEKAFQRWLRDAGPNGWAAARSRR